MSYVPFEDKVEFVNTGLLVLWYININFKIISIFHELALDQSEKNQVNLKQECPSKRCYKLRPDLGLISLPAANCDQVSP